MSTCNNTILITGGTSGLGYYCALDVARWHPESSIVLVSRTDPNSAATAINESLGQSNVKFLHLDLSNLAKIRSFAKDWEATSHPPIQALLLNAGLQFPDGVRYTDDRIETTFGVNHVGHALLFHLLTPYLGDKARVVITASGTHDPAQKTGLPDAKYTTAEELAHPTAETAKNDGRQRYATSKLANVMWTYALHRRFAHGPGKSRTAVAFDPGLVPGTGLAREAPVILQFVWNYILPYMVPLLRRFLSANVHTAQESGTA